MVLCSLLFVHLDPPTSVRLQLSKARSLPGRPLPAWQPSSSLTPPEQASDMCHMASSTEVQPGYLLQHLVRRKGLASSEAHVVLVTPLSSTASSILKT